MIEINIYPYVMQVKYSRRVFAEKTIFRYLEEYLPVAYPHQDFLIINDALKKGSIESPTIKVTVQSLTDKLIEEDKMYSAIEKTKSKFDRESRQKFVVKWRKVVNGVCGSLLFPALIWAGIGFFSSWPTWLTWGPLWFVGAGLVSVLVVIFTLLR